MLPSIQCAAMVPTYSYQWFQVCHLKKEFEWWRKPYTSMMDGWLNYWHGYGASELAFGIDLFFDDCASVNLLVPWTNIYFSFLVSLPLPLTELFFAAVVRCLADAFLCSMTESADSTVHLRGNQPRLRTCPEAESLGPSFITLSPYSQNLTSNNKKLNQMHLIFIYIICLIGYDNWFNDSLLCSAGSVCKRRRGKKRKIGKNEIK